MVGAGIAQQRPGVPQLEVVDWPALVAVRPSWRAARVDSPGDGECVEALLAQPARQAGRAARRAGWLASLRLAHEANRRVPTFRQPRPRLDGG